MGFKLIDQLLCLAQEGSLKKDWAGQNIDPKNTRIFISFELKTNQDNLTTTDDQKILTQMG